MYEIKIFIPKIVYYNKWKERIPFWDSYGIANAVSWQEDGEELYYTFFGSSKQEAEKSFNVMWKPQKYRREDICHA